jgi:hypothetical protein
VGGEVEQVSADAAILAQEVEVKARDRDALVDRRRPESAGVRVVQLTPAGSACSIVVADIERARAELLGRGVEVGAVEDVGGGVKYAWLADPDGNTLTLQEMSWRTGDKF